MTPSTILAGLLVTAPAAPGGTEPGPSVGVLRVRFEGAMAAATREPFVEAVATTLGRGAYRSRTLPRDASCNDDACYADFIKAQDLALLVDATVEHSDRDFSMRITIRDGSGAVTVVHEDACSVCGLYEAVERFAVLLDATDRSLGSRTDTTAIMSIESSPPGAEVLVDGRLAGRTPIEVSTLAGAHRIRVQVVGYEASERDVNMNGGAREVFRFTLSEEDRRQDRRQMRRPTRAVGYALLGLGIATTAAGAALVAIHDTPYRGRCSGSDVDVTGRCRFRFDTQLGGGLSLAFGLAITGTGVGLIIHDALKHRRAPRR